MKKFNLVLSVTESLFIDMFRKYNRLDNYSYQGLQELYEYLVNLSDDIGEPIELDVIGLCCDYYESTAQDIINDYKSELKEMLNDDYYEGDLDHIAGEWLQDQGLLISEYNVNGVTYFLYRPY